MEQQVKKKNSTSKNGTAKQKTEQEDGAANPNMQQQFSNFLVISTGHAESAKQI